MWLCSVSKRDDDHLVEPTHSWRRPARRYAEILIDKVLGDCGDRAIQRQFRMCVTACRHRATTVAERAKFPRWFLDFIPRDIAGAPVEVLWSRGIPGEYDATRPCLNPTLAAFDADALHRGLYLPIPCEACASCLENERVRGNILAHRRATPGTYLLETA